MKYKVVTPYNDAPAHPIEVKQGETLQVIEESNPKGDWPNWVLCQGLAKQGWVPKQILQLDNHTATVLKDYIATEHNLLVDEQLTAEYELNGWVWAFKHSAPTEFAWAPLNCMAEI